MLKQIVKLRVEGDGVMPVYATGNSSGLDISCAENFVIQPNEHKHVKTGLYVQIPEGFEFQIRPRSGLAAKYGLMVTNAPGTVDCGFTGEIGVLLYNAGKEALSFNQGDRIAQIVLCPVVHCIWDINTPFNETERGAGGFGHTGI